MLPRIESLKPSVWRHALGAALIAVVLACSGGDGTGPSGPVIGNGSPVGRYVLAQIDGHDLPHLYDQGPVSGGTIKRYWLSGEVGFDADSTFTIRLVGKTTGPLQTGLPQTTSWSGTWRLEPGGVELRNSGGVAHWASNDQLASLNVPATFSKVGGGSGSLQMTFGKQ